MSENQLLCHAKHMLEINMNEDLHLFIALSESLPLHLYLLLLLILSTIDIDFSVFIEVLSFLNASRSKLAFLSL